MENPEDPNKLDIIYIRLTEIERRLDELDKKHNELRDDYQFRGGRRKKTRRKKKKKKRHIITRKKKRKRRRRTKKRRKGGMPKGPKPPRVDQLRKSVLRPSGASNKKFTKRKKVTFRPLRRSGSVRSGLNARDMFQSKIQPPQQEQQEQQQTQAPQLVQMMEDLSVSSETQQQPSESKQ